MMLPSSLHDVPAEKVPLLTAAIAAERTGVKKVLIVTGGFLLMKSLITTGLTSMLVLGMTGIAIAQENASQNQARPAIHGPRSIDEELDHLTKDMELTPKQRKQIRPLLEEHHDKIQALFDKNPGVSRQDLGPQIHAVSDETHRQIHALLTEHQKQLERTMQERMHHGEQTRRPPAESR
jgi:Spy/CpxP family protein refolding chaperone